MIKHSILEFPFIIIVDSNAPLVHVIAQYIASLHLSLIKFTTYEKVFEFFEKHPRLVSLLITNIGPNNEGEKLFHDITPDLWVGGKKLVIFTTGSDTKAEKFRNNGYCVIEKPYVHNVVVKIVSDALK